MTPTPRNLGRNAPLLCAFNALQMSLFPMAIIAIFWKAELGLGMTGIMLLQAFFGLVMVCCEFPSGYLADRIGYRNTLLIASLITLAGWGVYASATSLPPIVVAEALLGVGLALVSGANTALLYESLSETGRDADFGRWYGRMRFCGQAGEGTAALFAGLLYATWSRLPFVLELVVWSIAALVALRMVEPAFHRPVITDHWAHVRGIVRYAAREAPRLRVVIFLMVVFSLSSFVVVWMISLYAHAAGVPLAWLGPLWAAANYTVAIGSILSDRVGRALGLLPTLLVCIGLIAVGYAGLGLSHGLYGFAFYYVLTLMRGLYGTVLHHEEQRLIPSGDRAGFVSLRSLLFRGSFLVVGPCVGAAVDTWGQHAALLALGGLCVALAAAGWSWLASIPPPHAEPVAR